MGKYRDAMDNNASPTVVSVHSPLIQVSPEGGYYTSYAISLKSTDPSFTHPFSQTRRRYSEFLHLRDMLSAHHTEGTKPPLLPPKNYFHRFNDDFIEERKIGLQHFLEKVLSTPVYLSDKSLHLFLQSTTSMARIAEQCLGDIPIPELLDEVPHSHIYHSDTSSNVSSDSNNNKSSPSPPKPYIAKFSELSVSSKTTDNSSDCESGYSSLDDHDSPKTPDFKGTKSHPRLISRVAQSLESTPSSSLSSLDSSSNVSSLPVHLNHNRRVSFNENVTFAVVCNQLWNIEIKRIKTE